jgi:hypothetical protein
MAAIIGAVLIAGVAISPLLTGQLQVANAQAKPDKKSDITSDRKTTSGFP